MKRILLTLLMLIAGTAQAARSPYQQAILRDDGRLATGGRALVWLYGTHTQATVYDANGVAIAQPLQQGADGYVECWLDQGQYTVKHFAPHLTPKEFYVIAWNPGGADSLVVDHVVFGSTIPPATPAVGDTYFDGSNLRTWDGDSWVSGVGGSGIGNVSEDTSPTLGGILDVGEFYITSAGANSIALVPGGTGRVFIDAYSMPTTAGTAGQVLTTNGVSEATWSTPAAGAGDVTGPAGGVTTNEVVGFANTTGKVLKGTGASISGGLLSGVDAILAPSTYSWLQIVASEATDNTVILDNQGSGDFDLDLVDGDITLATGKLVDGRDVSADGAVIDALGTAASQDVGTDVGDVLQLVDVGGGAAGLPAVDGSLLTGIAGAGDVTGPASSTLHGIATYYDTTGNVLENNTTQLNSGTIFGLSGISNTTSGFSIQCNAPTDQALIAQNIGAGDFHMTIVGNGVFSGTVTADSLYSVLRANGKTTGHVLTVQADGSSDWAAQTGGGDMSAATYDPASIAQQMLGTTATQTVTNKTIDGDDNTLQDIAVAALATTGTPDGTKFLRDDGAWTTPAGAGDVAGPSGGTVDGEVALYDDTTGKLLKGSGVTISLGVLSGLAGLACPTDIYADSSGDGITFSDTFSDDVAFRFQNDGAGLADVRVDGSVIAGDSLIVGDPLGTGYALPLVDGTNGQVIATNGAGQLSFVTGSGGGSGVITDMTGTANRLVYVNGSGEVSELSYGTANYALLSAGATSTPTFGAVVRPSAPSSYSAGAKQSFRADATSADIRLVGGTAEPGTLEAGDIWYRSDAGTFNVYDTTSRALVTTSGIQTLTNKTLGSTCSIPGSSVTASAITDGYVLTANGAGAAAWEAPTGGGGTVTDAQWIAGPSRAVLWEDFYGNNETYPLVSWDLENSGGTSAFANTLDLNRFGAVSLTATTAGQAAGRRIFDTMVEFGAGGPQVTFRSGFRVEDLADGTDQYTVQMGFGDTTAAVETGQTDCFFALYSNDDASIRFYSRTGGSGTYLDSAVDVSADTWYSVMGTASADGDSLYCYVNDNFVGAITTNIPGSTDAMSPRFQMQKEAGTTARVAYLDYFAVRYYYTTPR